MNIVLAGMPGCGKTTVSKILGDILGVEVIDTDALIVKKYGPISKIFAERGEDYFRQIETQTVESVSSLSGVVIATGGGCLLKDENVKLFKNGGKIVYLKTSVITLLKRVGKDTSRPLLIGDTEKKLDELYKQRSHKYETAADFIVETDYLTPEEVAAKITELVK